VIFQPTMIGVRRRNWRRTLRVYPSCQEASPHDTSSDCVMYPRLQPISIAGDSPAERGTDVPETPVLGAISTIISARWVDSRRSWWNYCLCKHLAR